VRRQHGHKPGTRHPAPGTRHPAPDTRRGMNDGDEVTDEDGEVRLELEAPLLSPQPRESPVTGSASRPNSLTSTYAV